MKIEKTIEVDGQKITFSLDDPTVVTGNPMACEQLIILFHQCSEAHLVANRQEAK